MWRVGAEVVGIYFVQVIRVDMFMCFMQVMNKGGCV